MKISNSQQGFAAVEAVLIVIVLGIIGFTGWFVVHAQKATDKTLASTGNSSVTTTKQTTKTPAKTADAQKYLTIKEWGVKLPLSIPINDAVYQIDTSITDIEAVNVSLSSLATTTCGLSKDGGAGSIWRFTQTQLDTYTNKTYRSEFPLAKQAGNYFYLFHHNEGACSMNDQDQAKADAAVAPFNTAVNGVVTAN